MNGAFRAATLDGADGEPWETAFGEVTPEVLLKALTRCG